jgi:hypothetical protein
MSLLQLVNKFGLGFKRMEPYCRYCTLLSKSKILLKTSYPDLNPIEPYKSLVKKTSLFTVPLLKSIRNPKGYFPDCNYE